jgi:CheY-like chemotaxis protein
MSTILCIDDEDANLTTMKSLLERCGHRVLAASSGVAGLALLRNNSDVNLVVLDYRMEPMDGMDVGTEIKSSFPWIPILLHSGQGDVPAQLLTIANAVVAKGSPIPELLSCIDRLLGRTAKAQPSRAGVDRRKHELRLRRARN